MTESTNQKQEQKHPQEKTDGEIIETIKQEISEENQAELARLLIRYKGFPGAYKIQKDLQEILEKWGLTEEKLFEITRELHNSKQIFLRRTKKGDEEEWNQ